MSLLFPEIDRQQTLDRISLFFKKDLERLLLMSGHGLTDLSSPILSLAPAHTNFRNPNEDKLIRGLDAESMVQAVDDAIHHCSPISKTIMLQLYIHKRSWEQVKPMVYSENHKFSYLRRKAMLEFADAFDYWQKVHHCQPIIDLHVYKTGNEQV